MIGGIEKPGPWVRKSPAEHSDLSPSPLLTGLDGTAGELQEVVRMLRE